MPCCIPKNTLKCLWHFYFLIGNACIQGGGVESSSSRSPASFLDVLHLYEDPRSSQDSLSTQNSCAFLWNLPKVTMPISNRDNHYGQGRSTVPGQHLTTLLSKSLVWFAKYSAGRKKEIIHFVLSALEVSNSYQCLKQLYCWIVLSKRLTKHSFIYSLFALWFCRIENLWSVFSFILNETQKKLL